jgi:hypothetical protein
MITALLVSLFGFSAPPPAHHAHPQPVRPSYSTTYAGYCVNHDLCDFQGGNATTGG